MIARIAKCLRIFRFINSRRYSGKIHLNEFQERCMISDVALAWLRNTAFSSSKEGRRLVVAGRAQVVFGEVQPVGDSR